MIDASERRRLAALYRYRILDTLPEPEFERAASLAAKIFRVPCAFVSFVDETRQWFKATVGCDWIETSRDIAFCDHAIRQNDVVVVPDARTDGRFRSNPLVVDAPHIRFYAGAPLRTRDGMNVGTLCIADLEPREFDAEDRAILASLAYTVVSELELRLRLLRHHDDAATVAADDDPLATQSGAYISVSNAGTAVVFQTDLQGRWSFLSDAWTDLTGYTVAESLGRSPLELIAHDGWETAREIVGPLLRGERRQLRYEALIRCKSGITRWIEVSAWRNHAEAGSRPGFSGTMTNITRQRVVEENLRRARIRHKALLDTMMDGIITVDANGRVVECNPAAEATFGYSRAEMVGHEIADLIIPDRFRRAHLAGIRKLSGTDQPFPPRRCEVIAQRADGTEFPAELSLSGFAVEGAMFCTAHVRDLSARYESERRATSAENRIDQVGRALPSILYEFVRHPDGTQRFTFITERAFDLLGLPPQDALSDAQLFFNMLPSEDRLRLLADLDVSATRIEALNSEFRIDANGQPRWVVAQAIPRRENDGRIVWAGLISDITDRKIIEKELHAAKAAAEAADRVKTSFLATVSHEIRTPMNAILGTLDLLRTEEMGPVPTARISTAYTAAEALLRIVNDTLSLIKVDSDNFTLETVPFSVGDAVGSVADTFKASAAGKGLKILSEIGVSGERLGDLGCIKQVLINLVGNAIKFTERGSVTLAAQEAEGGRVRLAVRDTGMGIAAADLPNLFEEFSQANASISRRFGGTGLGLAICRKLVKRMGGDIGADSKVGQGSTFWFELPLRPASPARAPEPVAEPVPPAPLGRKILVVDDVPLNREIAMALLSRSGHTVEFATDGCEAVEAATHKVFDLILMDVTMPKMGGCEASQAIRALPAPACDVPIVAFTARAFPDDRQMCLSAGMDDVLTKPISRSRLDEAVERWARPVPQAAAAHPEPTPAVPSHQPSPQAETAMIDPEALRRMSKEMTAAVMKRCCRSFIVASSQAVPRIRDLLAARDFPTLSREAHTLKGGAATFGLMRLADIAREIELGCRDPEQAQFNAAAQLPDVVAKSVAYLERHITTLE